MSFFCCNRILNVRSFFISSDNFETVKVEFKRCPHCGQAFYKEIRTEFRGNKYNTTIKKGAEAEILIKKAYLNRLDFLTRQNTGTSSNQNWFYGDFKRSVFKDEKGNPLDFQIKRNFNGEEVENYGLAKVNYYK